MDFRPQRIKGCYVIAMEPVVDERGFFARIYSEKEFEENGLVSGISQINLSRSEAPGTTRGIHWQEDPHGEAKLVRCVSGRVFDVCVDLRPESTTWGTWLGVELNSTNGLALYVPPGCGHAYQTLESGTELIYTTSKAYTPEAERGVRFDDPLLSIDWPLGDGLTISAKDRSWPTLDAP